MFTCWCLLLCLMVMWTVHCVTLYSFLPVNLLKLLPFKYLASLFGAVFLWLKESRVPDVV